RRRHTRFSRDWSSDVCSSDLDGKIDLLAYLHVLFPHRRSGEVIHIDAEALGRKLGEVDEVKSLVDAGVVDENLADPFDESLDLRSEERRVGKESRENLVCRLL